MSRSPGFDDTNKSDAEILNMIAAFLSTAYAFSPLCKEGLTKLYRYENGKKLAGIIYLHRISDVRMGGISKRNFRLFRELCGDSTLKNVAIVTNMWNEVSLDVATAREQELANEDAFFKPAIEKQAQL